MHDIENMSREELIELLNKKESEIEQLQETIVDLYNTAFALNSIDNISISSPEDYTFSNLIISTDEEDNSREVSDAEKTFEKNKETIEQLQAEMVSDRKEKLSKSVDNYLSLLKLGINTDIYTIIDLAQLDFENLNYTKSILSQLVGYTPNRTLLLHFNNNFCLSLFSEAAKLPQVEKKENIQQAIYAFLNHFLEEKTVYKNFSGKSFNYDEKVELLQKNYFKNSNILDNAIALREQNILNKMLENNAGITNLQQSRL